MAKRPKLFWDHWNREHIKKYQVAVEEVEEAYENSFAEIASYKGRKLYFGKAKNGRLIAVAVSFGKQSGPYPVSVRPMNKKERQLYYEKN